MVDNKNVELDDNAMSIATGGQNIITGLKGDEVLQVAAKVVELSDVPSPVKTLVNIATNNSNKKASKETEKG